MASRTGTPFIPLFWSWLILLVMYLAPPTDCQVYASCPGKYSTGYCSTSSKTHCCYSSCCNAFYYSYYPWKYCSSGSTQLSCTHYSNTFCCLRRWGVDYCNGKTCCPYNEYLTQQWSRTSSCKSSSRSTSTSRPTSCYTTKGLYGYQTCYGTSTRCCTYCEEGSTCCDDSDYTTKVLRGETGCNTGGSFGMIGGSVGSIVFIGIMVAIAVGFRCSRRSAMLAAANRGSVYQNTSSAPVVTGVDPSSYQHSYPLQPTTGTAPQPYAVPPTGQPQQPTGAQPFQPTAAPYPQPFPGQPYPNPNQPTGFQPQPSAPQPPVSQPNQTDAYAQPPPSYDDAIKMAEPGSNQPT